MKAAIYKYTEISNFANLIKKCAQRFWKLKVTIFNIYNILFVMATKSRDFE